MLSARLSVLGVPDDGDAAELTGASTRAGAAAAARISLGAAVRLVLGACRAISDEADDDGLARIYVHRGRTSSSSAIYGDMSSSEGSGSSKSRSPLLSRRPRLVQPWQVACIVTRLPLIHDLLRSADPSSRRVLFAAVRFATSAWRGGGDDEGSNGSGLYWASLPQVVGSPPTSASGNASGGSKSRGATAAASSTPATAYSARSSSRAKSPISPPTPTSKSPANGLSPAVVASGARLPVLLTMAAGFPCSSSSLASFADESGHSVVSKHAAGLVASVWKRAQDLAAVYPAAPAAAVSPVPVIISSSRTCALSPTSLKSSGAASVCAASDAVRPVAMSTSGPFTVRLRRPSGGVMNIVMPHQTSDAGVAASSQQQQQSHMRTATATAPPMSASVPVSAGAAVQSSYPSTVAASARWRSASASIAANANSRSVTSEDTFDARSPSPEQQLVKFHGHTPLSPDSPTTDSSGPTPSRAALVAACSPVLTWDSCAGLTFNEYVDTLATVASMTSWTIGSSIAVKLPAFPAAAAPVASASTSRSGVTTPPPAAGKPTLVVKLRRDAAGRRTPEIKEMGGSASAISPPPVIAAQAHVQHPPTLAIRPAAAVRYASTQKQEGAGALSSYSSSSRSSPAALCVEFINDVGLDVGTDGAIISRGITCDTSAFTALTPSKSCETSAITVLAPSKLRGGNISRSSGTGQYDSDYNGGAEASDGNVSRSPRSPTAEHEPCVHVKSLLWTVSLNLLDVSLLLLRSSRGIDETPSSRSDDDNASASSGVHHTGSSVDVLSTVLRTVAVAVSHNFVPDVVPALLQDAHILSSTTTASSPSASSSSGGSSRDGSASTKGSPTSVGATHAATRISAASAFLSSSVVAEILRQNDGVEDESWGSLSALLIHTAATSPPATVTSPYRGGGYSGVSSAAADTDVSAFGSLAAAALSSPYDASVIAPSYVGAVGHEDASRPLLQNAWEDLGQRLSTATQDMEQQLLLQQQQQQHDFVQQQQQQLLLQSLKAQSPRSALPTHLTPVQQQQLPRGHHYQPQQLQPRYYDAGNVVSEQTQAVHRSPSEQLQQSRDSTRVPPMLPPLAAGNGSMGYGGAPVVHSSVGGGGGGSSNGISASSSVSLSPPRARDSRDDAIYTTPIPYRHTERNSSGYAQLQAQALAEYQQQLLLQSQQQQLMLQSQHLQHQHRLTLQQLQRGQQLLSPDQRLSQTDLPSSSDSHTQWGSYSSSSDGVSRGFPSVARSKSALGWGPSTSSASTLTAPYRSEATSTGTWMTSTSSSITSGDGGIGTRPGSAVSMIPLPHPFALSASPSASLSPSLDLGRGRQGTASSLDVSGLSPIWSDSAGAGEDDSYAYFDGSSHAANLSRVFASVEHGAGGSSSGIVTARLPSLPPLPRASPPLGGRTVEVRKPLYARLGATGVQH